MTTQQANQRSIGHHCPVVVALLLAATTIYILFDPVSPSDLESTTAVDWTAFSEANPKAAEYSSREGRLLAV